MEYPTEDPHQLQQQNVTTTTNNNKEQEKTAPLRTTTDDMNRLAPTTTTGESLSSVNNNNNNNSEVMSNTESNVGITMTTHRAGPNPLLKLTRDLLATYKHINVVYYEAKRKRQQLNATGAGTAPTSTNAAAPHSGTTTSAPSNATTNAVEGVPSATSNNNAANEEDYRITLGEVLNGRYRVEAKLGRGSFGQVVRAFDKKTERQVAIKIIKARSAFRKQAQIEIRLLGTLNRGDERDEYNVVRLLDIFEHAKHQCLVFELLFWNLYDLLRSTKFKGVSLSLIKKFSYQILKSLQYLKRMDVIHCDLKPENILLRQAKRSALKVIDFGSSCFVSEKVYVYIQSRFYRSPEVILGCSYDCAIDMWSLGCILVEMHVGEPLFSGTDEAEQIQLFIQSRGMPPKQMLDRGTKTSKFFTRDGEGDYRVLVVEGKKGPKHEGLPLRQALGLPGLPTRIVNQHYNPDLDEQYNVFLDLLDRMLAYDPAERITPDEALTHPFFEDLILMQQPPTVPAATTVTINNNNNNNAMEQQQQQQPRKATRSQTKGDRAKRPDSC